MCTHVMCRDPCSSFATSVEVFATLDLLAREEPGYVIGSFTADTSWKSRDLVN